jgi:hypothetical protein
VRSPLRLRPPAWPEAWGRAGSRLSCAAAAPLLFGVESGADGLGGPRDRAAAGAPKPIRAGARWPGMARRLLGRTRRRLHFHSRSGEAAVRWRPRQGQWAGGGQAVGRRWAGGGGRRACGGHAVGCGHAVGMRWAGGGQAVGRCSRGRRRGARRYVRLEVVSRQPLAEEGDRCGGLHLRDHVARAADGQVVEPLRAVARHVAPHPAAAVDRPRPPRLRRDEPESGCPVLALGREGRAHLAARGGAGVWCQTVRTGRLPRWWEKIRLKYHRLTLGAGRAEG